MTSEQAIEKEIQVKSSNGPRVSPADIEAIIVDEVYHEFPGTTVTVCMLVLRNGAKVIGYNYGAIAADGHDPGDVGKSEARAMAVDKVWELEGYLLRDRLAKK